MSIEIEITGRDAQDEPTFVAKVNSSNRQGWTTFSIRAPQHNLDAVLEHMPETFRSMLKLLAKTTAVMLRHLSVDDIGRWVEYDDHHGKIERGRIKGWTSEVVHVVYGESARLDNWADYTGQATSPGDLHYIEEPKE